VSSITIVSEAPNCGIPYDRHYGDHNSFIIQAIVVAHFHCDFNFPVKLIRSISKGEFWKAWSSLIPVYSF
jgi:hypothetical protein